MIYAFADCEIDTERFELRRDGARVMLEPQVLDLLILLVENRERLVGKDEIHAHIWKGRIVSDAALSSRIKAARQAIGDSGKDQRLIETLHGRGFRFRGEVDAPAGPSAGRWAAGGAMPAAETPGIAVLPFANASGDPANDVIADGVTEEVINALSQFRWYRVIARASVDAYRGPGLDLRRIGVDLGVRYVVRGSFLRHGAAVRVPVQLIEAATGRQVAATRLDLDFDDLFALFDRIAAGVIGALHPELLGAEIIHAERTAPSDQTAWQLFIRAQSLLMGPGAAANTTARRLLVEAIAREPVAARAHSALALTYLWDVVFGWTADPTAAMAAAQRAAAAALGLGPVDGWAAIAMGGCRLMSRDHDGALHDMRLAVALQPNSALARGALALTLAFSGEAAPALDAAAEAHALSPADPRAVIWLNAEGIAAFHAGLPERGLRAGRRIVALQPDYPTGHRIVAANAAALGDSEAARAAVARIAELLPGHSVRDVLATVPFRRRSDAEAWAAALVRAGLPA